MDTELLSINPTIAPVIAPVNNFTPTSTNINNNIAYDQELSNDKKTVLNVLFTSLVTGSAAAVLGESPLYFGSLGALMAALRGLRSNEIASLSPPGRLGELMSPETMLLAGGVLLSNVAGKNILNSAIILGAGAYLGPVL